MWRLFVSAVCIAIAVPTAADGAGPDAKSLRARTLQSELFVALRDRDVNAVKAVLRKGADPNARNWLNFTALMWAANRGQQPLVDALLAKGADLNAESMYGSALTFAENGRHEDLARYLLKRGAAVEPDRLDGAMPLMIAAANGHLALLKELLARGSKVNRKDEDGATALIYAARLGQAAAAKTLIAAGANVNTADSHGRTALMYAAANGEPAVVSLLLSAHAKVNARDAQGATPLLLAARYGADPQCVRLLLQAGADKSARDSSGRTSLALAQARGYESVATALRDAGAPAFATTAGGTGAVDSKLAAQRSVAAIQAGLKEFASRTQCVSCHHQGLGLMALGVAQQKGLAVDRALIGSYMQRVGEDGKDGGPAIHAALQNPEATKLVPPVQIADFAVGGGYVLGGLISNGVPSNPGLAEAALFIGRLQFPDGHWAYGFQREPMQSSFITTTALALRVLKAYGPQDGPAGAEIAQRIGRAQKWLLSVQAPSTEDKASRVIGLVWSGAAKPEIARAAQDLLAAQKSDGGWAEIPDRHSDAYATGLSLYALRIGGAASGDSAARRAVEFLVRTQDEDGSWYIQKRTVAHNSYFDAGFPHGESQYASLAATCWAAMALMESTPASQTVSR